MTVAELIRSLREYPDDFIVIQSKDAEGNDYSPVCELDSGFYEPETTWSGEYYGPDVELENEEDFTYNAVCIWPIN